MDAFYAAVEVRDDPSLAGKALIIGHKGERGVVSTCSYEARRYGVHSAMPSVTAMRLCPDAIWLPGRMKRYASVSRSLRRLFATFTPLVEPLSIDEAFLDLTGIAMGLGAGSRAAEALRTAIKDTEKITGSVGVAPNKFLAKIASDMDKPDGQVVLSREDVPRLLWPLPVRRLWGVGPKMEARLLRLSLKTVGDLAAIPEARLEHAIGQRAAVHFKKLARGEDDRPVATDRAPRSISEERTYARDLHDQDAIDRSLLARAEGVARDLRRKGFLARTLILKVRTGDFRTVTRSHTLAQATDLTETLVGAARELFKRRIRLEGRGVRLLGVGAGNLVPRGEQQEDLFPEEATVRARRLARATDAIRTRYGDSAVTRARLSARSGAGTSEDAEDEASSLPAVD
jgi:DNA polymerase-4